MTQRLPFLYVMAWLACMLWIFPAAAAGTPSQKDPETNFNAGMRCLKSHDVPCAQLALAGIPNSSPYNKVLAGNIAVVNQDYDQAMLMLLPLQNNQSLSSAAHASLHTSLAQAYENQSDSQHALEQHIRAENYLSPPDILTNQQNLWRYLSSLSRDELVQVRGDTMDTALQGWIDLALASRAPGFSPDDLVKWRNAYPDHLASEQLLQQLAADAKTKLAAAHPNALEGKIALILPFSADAFYPAADAIQRGFVAAQTLENSSAQVAIYATDGSKDNIESVYAQALAEGANYVAGPLTRDEVSALPPSVITVPTLALNQPDAPVATPGKLYFYGLSVDSEAQQVVRTARRLGMQTAAIVTTDDPISNRMTKAFSDAWTADGGQVKLQVSITQTTDFAALKTDIGNNPTDMIFLAATAESARVVRPSLDPATPTFGLSHLYGGIIDNPDDAPLLGVRFVDMPWMLQPENPAFAVYKDAADDLPAGEMQRWFALGADAYHILANIVRRPGIPVTINGLSGKIRIDASGTITRELALASFERDGIVLEKTP